MILVTGYNDDVSGGDNGGGGIGGDDDSNIGDNECADSDNSSGSDNKRCHDQI